jgi:predicted metal-dependent phosphoesterase TrpH
VASLAHPIRVDRHHGNDGLEDWVEELRGMGMRAMEAFHSDHNPADTARYLDMAGRLDLAVTGGSDFHGANKPGIQLGRGSNGNLDIPRALLDRLRAM